VDQATVRRAIARKRDGERLDDATWAQLVAAYLDELFDDAQMAALLMACVVRGLDAEETHALTAAFVASGETLVAPDPRTVDKHSTGGVGDTASLVVVPLVAACGYPVAKLSGRALGHTGGTLDKLEAVPGVRTDLTPERFFACVAEAGCAIAAQSERLVPADKRIYALRDRTATVDSPGLIATSIVSKKIAGGAPSIVYDVKTGRGALLARSEEAEDLARSLVALTRAFGRRAAAVISDMNEPLGTSIGTGLEAIEARDFLRGVRRDPRLAGVCTTLATTMLSLADFSGDASAAVEQALASGAAAERFERMLRAQGAHAGALDALQPHASAARAVAEGAGIVLDVDAVALGELARELVLRAGPLAGIIVDARIGDRVARGDSLARVYGEPEFAGAVARAFILGDGPVPPRPLIYDVTS
jgi:pyrimidine-nucleoside phosphorylase